MSAADWLMAAGGGVLVVTGVLVARAAVRGLLDVFAGRVEPQDDEPPRGEP